jgi:phage replication-related protein YjqB (UPF0714/DUF867 family)
MATSDAAITRAQDAQEDLKANAEHCSADPGLLATIGRAHCQQVRVYRDPGAFGLYTVSEVRPETPGSIVRMGRRGRERLGTDAEFPGLVDSRVPRSRLSEDRARAEGELVERLDDDGVQAQLIVIAPHGGDIEPSTDQQAERVADRLAARSVSSWRCKGWKPGGGAFDRWHITSTDLNEACFPRLARVMSRGFTHAVAFHGFERPEVLIGGTATTPPSLKDDLREAIDAATGPGIVVRVATPDDHFGGDSPRNIVNRLTAGGTGGIQIEQSLQARDDHWCAIADAVADVYGALL